MKVTRLICAAAVSAAAMTTAAFAEDGRYILMLKNNANMNALSANVEAAGGTLVRTLPQVGIAVATSSDPDFAANAKSIGAVQDAGPVAVHALPDAETVEVHEDGPTPDDAFFNAGWLWGIDRVHAPAAWANGRTGEGTVIAVIDTGVASNHPDVGPNLVDNQCFASVPCTPYPSLSFHGTHVAGTAAGAFGHGQIVGVAPKAGIANYNVFEVIPGCGVCAFSDSRWAAMIDAADKGYDVINMSLGSLGQYGGGNSSGLATFVAAEKKIANYVRQQGTIMVASAGNAGVDLNGTLINVPGGVPQIINVGATAIRPLPIYPQDPAGFDIRAAYSNHGASVMIAAPGGDCNDLPCSFATGTANYLVISSSVQPNAACAATESCPVGYSGAGGTSMAAPHVSGVAALIREANPGASPQQVAAKLKQSAENIGSRQEFGHGMVRADQASQ